MIRTLAALLIVFHVAAHAKTSAIIERRSTHLLLEKPNELKITEFYRIQILDEEGYYHAVFRDYYNSFRKIRSLRCNVFDKAGNHVKRLAKRDAIDVMLNASYEIGDVRLVALDPEYKIYPFTVEYEVEIVYDGFLDFPTWMPRDMYDLEVKRADLVLEFYPEFKFKSREVRGIAAPKVVNTSNGRRRLEWMVENLPAVERHISYKSFAADQPCVYISPTEFTLEKTKGSFSSWTDFGEWYLDLNEGRNSLTADTKIFLDGLRQNHGADVGSITKDVYRHMQSKTRYISIQLGIGGYQAIPAEEVERTGYGDCKALSNYMKGMLDYLNIPSNYVLVNAGSDVPDMLHDFPSNQFNHVFVAVPLAKDTLWYECTSQTSPPAYIGTFTDDRFVLWVDRNRSQVLRTPAYPETVNKRKTNCIVTIEPKGDATLQLRSEQTGMYFDEVGYFQYLGKEGISQFNHRKFEYKDFSIESFKYEVPDKDKPELQIDYKLKVTALGSPLGTKMLLPINFLNPTESEFKLDPLNRKTEVRRSFTIEDNVEVQLPPNYRSDFLPDNFSEQTVFGSIDFTFERKDEQAILVKRKLVVRKGVYQNEDFDRLSASLKKLRIFENKKIVAIAKT